MSVRYALSPCDSWRHKTFHATFLDPEEDRRGVGTTKLGGRRAAKRNFTPDNTDQDSDESVRYVFSHRER